MKHKMNAIETLLREANTNVSEDASEMVKNEAG